MLSGGLFLAAVAYFGYQMLWSEDWRGVERVSRSIEEAKARGIWVRSLNATPSAVEMSGHVVHVKSAWIEAISKQTSRLGHTAEERQDGYNLCFTLEEKAQGLPGHFLTDGRMWLKEHSWGKDIMIYSADLDKPEEIAQREFWRGMKWADTPGTVFRFVAVP